MTILSLFDYTGNWSRPYHEAGYDVIQIDIKHGDDIYQLTESKVKDMGPIRGVLNAFPCDHFAVSGSGRFKDKDESGTTDDAIRLAMYSLQVIKWAKPDWYACENPVGRVESLMPAFRRMPNKFIFDPYEFGGWLNPPGDHYKKRTCLWGRFNRPIKKPTYFVTYSNNKGQKGSYMWALLGGKSKNTKEIRSTTPMGFAYAFKEANP